jgi:hypothetical protein
VLGERLRVSLVLDGNGRASVRTGDDERDDELEARARAAGWDLEVVAEPGTPVGGAVEAALSRAEGEAGAALWRP